MSEILKKDDKKTKKVKEVIDSNLEECSSLLAPEWMSQDLDDCKVWMSGSRYVDGGVQVPRFGLLSLKLQATPCYLYNHPALNAVAKTAFTDGLHIFIHTEFYEKLLNDSKESRGVESGVELLILHELMHMLLNHTRRMKQFPKNISNKATDLSINTKLQLGYPEMAWCKTLRETGLGFKPGDLEKYPQLSEESIARELMLDEFNREQENKKKNGQQSGPGQPGQQSGQGQPGQSGQGAGGKPTQGQGPGQPSDANEEGAGNDEPSDQFGGDGDNHMIDLEDLIDILEENDLGHVVDSLGLPRAGDPDFMDKIGAVREEGMLKDLEAVQKAAAQMNQLGAKYPGAHIVESVADVMKGFVSGKLSWRLAMREAVFGNGMRFKYNDEEPNDIYYVDELREITGVNLYIGQDMPYKPEECVLAMIDTSGSVNDLDVRAFLSEIFELKRASNGIGDEASEVIVLSADTVLRGEPIEINDNNIDELMDKGVKIFGRGGTDLGHSLKQAVKLPLFKEKKIRTVVYFTDLYDTPPQYKDLGLEEGVNVIYVAAPSTHSPHLEEFAKAVGSYARVYPIEEGLEVNCEAPLEAPVNTRKMKK